mmetsp:Transcript_43878/g.85832  ORF Transcript_43878/g.85832 Transcript_43878/m.85832 type:complete len:267 (-) Transcript_43878:247-1047(-)|eukprot:CAMPEP_0175159996 /NCGR_PEP_ID=MMETSP0087-20121206/23749_1 /TAXON_ID=136419 /ORGANISM="Unknown Unknown, Strain D1" /LENGTH=266 /DNA_ID=CAMNT_0016448141 /DNA_START=37 /DNA_END=837 /DNA_ORIENTATION=+
MEVLAAIDQGGSQMAHVTAALEVIKRTLAEHGMDKCALSFNGGKDCTVLLHLVRAAVLSINNSLKFPLAGLRVVYFKTTEEFEEVKTFMSETQQEHKYNVVELDGSFQQGLEKLISDTGVKAILMGQRRIDPAGSSLDVVCYSDPGWPQIIRVNPILDWTYHQVWSFLRDLNLPYCSLYDRGYTSIGSIYNTHPNPLLRETQGECSSECTYLPAYCLKDPSTERAGRYVPPSPSSSSSTSLSSSSSSSSSKAGGEAGSAGSSSASL